ncbi:MAG: MotA/TolQ/ExbB proton channel family protein [Gammaproteobacteria bacterium]|nr:MotA/TolQ/ExbB proton channel family protein [Gammaproteobacteria bacterium]
MEGIFLFFDKGGIFMWPIGFVLGLGIVIAIERYIYLSTTKASNKKMWNQLMPVLKDGSYQKAYAIASKSKSAISNILAYGLARVQTVHRRDDVETAMEEGLMEAIPRLEKRTHYLATLANISTLLGLLGTIMGLIKAFNAVSNADPALKADMLSGSISIAMYTTAFGLIAAIPLLLLHVLLQSKTTELVDSLEMASVKFLNVITKEYARKGGQ